MPKEAKKKQKPVDEELELEDEEVDEEEEEDEEVEETDDEETEDDEEDEAPAKGKKKTGKGSGKGSGLVPREPVSVPKAVYKAQPKEVQKLLVEREKLQAAGDKKGLRKIRMALRKLGFRLSQIGEAATD
jgi:hypothetical protein